MGKTVTDIVGLSDELAREISSRFVLSSLPKHIGGTMHISHERVSLLLVCPSAEVLSFLRGYDYHKIIAHILMYSELNETLLDIAGCHYTDNEISLIKRSVADAQESIKYHWDRDGLYFEAEEFYVDIVMESIRCFHLQILEAHRMFSKTIKECPDMKFFLQADSPSYISQYAQYWVAEKLDMTDLKRRIGVI